MKKNCLSALMLALLLIPQALLAQEENSQTTEQPVQILDVAVIERDPFVKIVNGQPVGFSIDLWNAIAAENEWETNYVVQERFVDLLAAAREAEADLAITNISITADRERVMDFSHDIFDSGLQIMAAEKISPVDIVIDAIQEKDFIITLALMALIFVFGLFILETRSYKKHLDDSLLSTTMSLLFFGWTDKHPDRDAITEMVNGVWFATFIVGLIVATFFFAGNYERIKENKTISDYRDLQNLRVGVTGGSTAENFMRREGVRVISYDDITRMFKDVANHSIDAAVHDYPIVAQYIRKNPNKPLVAVGRVFSEDRYGIALPEGSELREPINRTLLDLRESGYYTVLFDKWFSE